jgi:ABC-2 type transport system ATP-binding protein
LIDDGKILAHDSLNNLLVQHNEKGLEELFINLTGKVFRDSDV